MTEAVAKEPLTLCRGWYTYRCPDCSFILSTPAVLQQVIPKGKEEAAVQFTDLPLRLREYYQDHREAVHGCS